jgi:hypothetical protein
MLGVFKLLGGYDIRPRPSASFIILLRAGWRTTAKARIVLYAADAGPPAGRRWTCAAAHRLLMATYYAIDRMPFPARCPAHYADAGYSTFYSRYY